MSPKIPDAGRNARQQAPGDRTARRMLCEAIVRLLFCFVTTLGCEHGISCIEECVFSTKRDFLRFVQG